MVPAAKRVRTEMSTGLLAARKSFRAACRLLFLPEEEQGPTWSADVLALLATAGAVADDCARADDAVVPGRRTLKNPRWISALTHIDAASLLQGGGKVGRARARCEYAAALESHAESIEAHAGLARLIRLDASDDAAMAALDTHLSAAVRLGLTIDFDAIEESKSSAVVAIHERERDAFLAAREALSLLRCQTARRADDAAEHLLAQGFEYRLSTEVFCYSLAPLAALDAAAAKAQRTPLRVLNDALPSPLLRGLHVALGNDSPFWREHSYSGLGGEYFSYLHDLSAVLANPKRTVIEQTMKHVYGLAQSCFPDIPLDEARYCEWWTHNRPHSCGHQFHFDSDEPKLERGNGEIGAVTHPIFSTIIYLTPGLVGGPTLVTDQLLSGALATKGWLVLPALNRVAVFDGRYLHGVIPGRGACPPRAPDAAPEGNDPRRITLMIAFWRQKAWEKEQHPGPCQRFPYDLLPGAASSADATAADAAPGPGAASSSAGAGAAAEAGADAAQGGRFTWPAHFAPVAFDSTAVDPRYHPTPVAPHPVSTVWERIDHSAVRDPNALPDYERCFQGF
jgi:hypothetical protein